MCRLIRINLLFVVLITIFLVFSGCAPDPKSFPLEKALANGKPTLAEFGGTNCAPCKSMWPILGEIANEYNGKLNVVIIDVAKQQSLADKYDVEIIPMQIYFDANGQPIVGLRHVGVVTKEEIYAQLDKIGVSSVKTSTSN